MAGISLILVSSSGSATPSFQVVEPHDQSYVAGQFIAVTLRVADKGMDAIAVELKGKKSALAPRREYLCFGGLELEPGLNTLTVTAEKGGAVVQKADITVYRVVEVSKDSRVPPPGFGLNPFHTKAKEEVCKPCHKMEPGSSEVIPAVPSDSACYTCHRQVTGFSNVHGPAAVWGCLSCHEPGGNPVRYAVKSPTRDICFTCHKDAEEQWARKGFVHGPTATGSCTICHSPHASDNPFWLRKPAWELCTSCHEEKVTETHVVAGFVFGGTHPTKGRPDPLRKGSDLSCASCHNPHISDSRFFFVNGADSAFGLCQVCHEK
ncbi:MAG: cytochrome c3 family protein [Thermodesulfovibrionales bacterium]|jgi:predicted CXXCH cytochrome family protein